MSQKVTIKTLQQKVFTIDVEPSETVGDLKQKITDSQGHPTESQKIIFAGMFS
jgi:UV excision repair protein RAD23